MCNMCTDKKYLENKLQDYSTDFNPDSTLNDTIKSQMLELANSVWRTASGVNNKNNHIYGGNAGIAYMFWFLHKQNQLFDQQIRDEFLSKAKHLITKCLHSFTTSKGGEDISFFFGSAGVSLVSSLIFDSSNDQQSRDHYLNIFIKMCSVVVPLKYLPKGSDSLWMGRAGYMCGSLAVNRFLSASVISPHALQALGISIMKSGKAYASVSNTSLPIVYEYNGRIYLGNSHGLSGIILTLLSAPNITQMHPSFESHIKSVVDFILEQQMPNGSFPVYLDSRGARKTSNSECVEWCVGCSGIVWLLVKAYRLWNDNKYLDACLKCAELVWTRGLSTNAGLCHGVSGNGYVFLLLYRVTSDAKFLFRAQQFAKFILSEQFRSVCPCSRNNCGLYNGWSGVVCYLVDVLTPNEAVFPLFIDIFQEYSVANTEDVVTLDDSDINDDLIVQSIED